MFLSHFGVVSEAEYRLFYGKKQIYGGKRSQLAFFCIYLRLFAFIYVFFASCFLRGPDAFSGMPCIGQCPSKVRRIWWLFNAYSVRVVGAMPWTRLRHGASTHLCRYFPSHPTEERRMCCICFLFFMLCNNVCDYISFLKGNLCHQKYTLIQEFFSPKGFFFKKNQSEGSLGFMCSMHM